MGVLGPDAVVDPPPASSALHSLLATAFPATDPEDTRWQMGFTFPTGDTCAEGAIWIPTCDDAGSGSGSGSGEQTKSETEHDDAARFVPYQVITDYTCDAKFFKIADYEGHAERRLKAVQDRQIEHEFWTGERMAEAVDFFGNPVTNMSLAATTPTDGVLNDGGAAAPVAVSASVALSILQQGFADCGAGSRGMIHASAYIAEMWGAGNMLESEGVRLITRTRGTYVVSGTGYPGTQPDVVAQALGADEEWVFATGVPVFRLGDIDIVPDELSQALDRRVNKVTYHAERVAAVVWDECCTLAVLVDTSLGLC